MIFKAKFTYKIENVVHLKCRAVLAKFEVVFGIVIESVRKLMHTGVNIYIPSRKHILQYSKLISTCFNSRNTRGRKKADSSSF